MFDDACYCPKTTAKIVIKNACSKYYAVSETRGVNSRTFTIKTNIKIRILTISRKAVCMQ